MAWVWHRSQSKGATRLVALAIADHASDDGTNAWPSVARLAAMCACSESTVRRGIAELVELSEIRVELQAGGPKDMRDDKRPNRYTFQIRQHVDNPVDNPSNGVSPMTGRKGNGVSKTTLRGVTDDTLTVLNHPTISLENSLRRDPDKTVDNFDNGFVPLTAAEKEQGRKILKELRQKRSKGASESRQESYIP